MTAICEFAIPGTAQGKGRPRVVNKRAITPPKTRSHEGFVRHLAKQAMGAQFPHAGPVDMSVVIIKAIPGGWPKWKRDAARTGVVLPTGKPDPDNVAKLVCDALNGIAYLDDAQIVAMTIARRWGDRDETYVGVFKCEGVCASVKTKHEAMAAS